MTRTGARRSAATGATASVLLVGLVVARGHLLAESLLLFALVVVQGRSRLPWADVLPGGAIIRRSARVLVYFLPILLIGLPPSRLPWGALAAAVLVGVIGVVPEWRRVRRALGREFLQILGPIGASERTRDLILFAFSGLAQEYLYRHLLLTALTPTLGWMAVAASAAAFVAEHLAHPRGRHTWDRQDVLTHAFLALALGAIAYATGSWLAAAIGHTVYNLPNVVQTLARPGVRRRSSGSHASSPSREPPEGARVHAAGL